MNSNDSKPVHFLDLVEADLQEWRLLPQTVLLLEALRGESRGADQRCLQAARQGNPADSAYQAGWHDLGVRVADSIELPRVPKTATGAQDDTYRDPAQRLSKRRKIQAVTP